MQLVGGDLILSPTDVVNQLTCEHLTQLNLLAATGDLTKPQNDRSEVELIQQLGLQHEEDYLQQLKASDLNVVEIAEVGRGTTALRDAHDQTVAAMRAGADVIFQATFFDGKWRGHADFLFKTPPGTRTDLGDYGYEPFDTKLARTAKVSALVQLADYAVHIQAIQGLAPERVHIVLGDKSTSSFRTADVAGYHQRARARLVEATTTSSDTYPDPVSHCAICEWTDQCASQRVDDDHLSLVAMLGKPQIKSLATAGIRTMTELAQASADSRPPRMLDTTYHRLRRQARLQTDADGEPGYDLIDPALHPTGGMRLLPKPSSGDLFFDLEGDPYRGDDGTGLEYLWGISDVDNVFTKWWAHTSADERIVFEQCVDFFIERHTADPDMHIYHYADYEVTVLKRLASLHSSRVDQVDHLLRNEVFVDLYRVTRNSVRISAPRLSIKDLEAFYRPARDTQVQSGMASVVHYEEWIESGDHALLDDILAYNQDDCVSTRQLRDWLEARRTEATARWGDIPRHAVKNEDRSDKASERATRFAALRLELLAGLPNSRSDRTDTQQAQWVLAYLVEFHSREDKPSWWRQFAQRSMSPEELHADSEAVSGLVDEGLVGTVKLSNLYQMRFDPEQPHKLKPRSTMTDWLPGENDRHGSVNIHDLDAGAGTLTIKRGKTADKPMPIALIPDPPLDPELLEDAVADVATAWRGQGEGYQGCSQRFPAIHDLLTRSVPRTNSGNALRLEGESASAAVIRVAGDLHDSYLAVQGPPGTGKTYTGAHMIKALVAAGKTVGVVANSHRVVENMLERLADVAPSLRILKVGSEDPGIDHVTWESDSKKGVAQVVGGDFDVVGGTAWFFAREGMRQSLDVLVVDEAGQFSLANTVVSATAARNIVLLGDPQQLDQPVKGTHPPATATSALGHICGTEQTIPHDMGIFLDRTWRMSESVCAFVSDSFYNEQLEVEPQAPQRSIDGIDAGLYWRPVEHQNCRGRSHEEAAHVAALAAKIIGKRFRSTGGQDPNEDRPIGVADILFITPFNAQVQAIKEALAAARIDGATVGTVDLFQGREAPVVIYSMTSSQAEDAPRGINFLFNPNRFNVALSRAKVAAYVVASPALLNAKCLHPEQLPMVGALCNFVTEATVA